jgi:hypothetical protein
MQRMIFKNINCNFTFENLSPCLANFWSSEVCSARKSGESEVWICLTVKTKHESYKIIDIEPFSTKDYTYINNLLKKNIYYSSIFPKYIIKDLVFYYKFGSDC